ncbi:MAG: hypothetical protein JW788_06785, partial [Candidatus Omnitrophica bacterium]|nr:hypothetical protein [Candidatus Omnitrophota bacterium]
SLKYVFGLCLLAILAYNLLPGLALKILTGKAYPEAVFLGRLFSISMSLYSLLYLFIYFFLSVDDKRFLKYLAFFTLAQFFAISYLRGSIIYVQLILCLNAALLFIIHFTLFLIPRRNPGQKPAG